MKTLKDLRKDNITKEGLETILKKNKLQDHVSIDWINDKLVNFVISQDTAADKEELEKKKEEIAKDIKNDKKEKDTNESLMPLPIDEKTAKLKGDVKIIIKDLYKTITDDVTSKLSVRRCNVIYKDKEVGTIKIPMNSLKDLAVNPYGNVSCILTLDDGDLNILLRALKKDEIKENLISEGLMDGPVGFAAVVAGITGLFSGHGNAFSALGTIIFGGILGGTASIIAKKKAKKKEAEEKDKEADEKAKDMFERSRERLISSVDDKTYGEDDVKNIMDFFYDPSGNPYSIDEINEKLDGCDPKDVKALKKAADEYYEKNKGAIEAQRERDVKLTPEELDSLKEHNKSLIEKRTKEEEIKRIDKDLDTLDEEIEKLKDKDDEPSKRALARLQEERDNKKQEREETVHRIDELNTSIEETQKKVDEVNKNNPPLTQKEKDEANREANKDNIKELDKQISDLEKKIKSGKDENGNQYTKQEIEDMKDTLKNTQLDRAEAYGGPEERSKLEAEFKTGASRSEIQSLRDNVKSSKEKLDSVLKDPNSSTEAKKEALDSYKENIDALNFVDPGCKDVTDAEKIYNSSAKTVNNDRLAILKNKIQNGTDEEKTAAAAEYQKISRENWNIDHPEDKDLSDEELDTKILKNTKSPEEAEAIKLGREAMESEEQKKQRERENKDDKAKLQQLQDDLAKCKFKPEDYPKKVAEIHNLQDKLKLNGVELSAAESAEPQDYKSYATAKAHREDAEKIAAEMERNQTKTSSEDDYNAFNKAYDDNMKKLGEIYGTDEEGNPNLPEDIKKRLDDAKQYADDTHDVAIQRKDATSVDSQKEKAKVGIDKLTDEEKDKLNDLRSRKDELSDEEKLELRKMEVFIDDPDATNYTEFSDTIKNNEAAAKAEKEAKANAEEKLDNLRKKVENGEELDTLDQAEWNAACKTAGIKGADAKIPTVKTDAPEKAKVGIDKLSSEQKSEYSTLMQKKFDDLNDDEKKQRIRLQKFIDGDYKSIDDISDDDVEAEITKRKEDKANKEAEREDAKTLQDALKKQLENGEELDDEQLAAWNNANKVLGSNEKPPKPTKKAAEAEKTGLDKLSDEELKEYEKLLKMSPEALEKDDESTKRLLQYKAYIDKNSYKSLDDAKEDAEETWNKMSRDKINAQLDADRKKQEKEISDRQKNKKTEEYKSRYDELTPAQQKEVEDIQNMDPEDIKKDPEMQKKARVYAKFFDGASLEDATSEVEKEIENETKKERDKKVGNGLKTVSQLKAEQEPKSQKISLTDEQSKELTELLGKDSRSDEEEIRMRTLTLMSSKGLSEEDAKKEAEKNYNDEKTKEDSRKADEMALAMLVADDPKITETDSYKELAKNYKEKYGVDFNSKKALEIATDGEGSNGDLENDKDDNDAEGKNVNPATIWRKRKKKNGTGLTTYFYNAKGDSISPTVFQDKMDAYNEKKKKNKEKAEKERNKANESRVFKLGKGRLKTLQEMKSK